MLNCFGNMFFFSIKNKFDRWVKERLVSFEETLSSIFPKHWEVSEEIAVEFCRITREELSKVMRQRSSEIDVNLLLFAIQHTKKFEKLLADRLTGATLRRAKSAEAATNPFLQDEKPTEAEAEKDEEGESPFIRIISSCFEPFLHIYIQSQDQSFRELMTKFEADIKEKVDSIRSGKATESFEGEELASCGVLFTCYRKCLKNCFELSTGKPLCDLALIFQKYLREYANKIMMKNLPKMTGASGNSGPNISGPLSLSAVTNLINKPANQNPRLSDGEVTLVCSVLTTADYCLDTVAQLEEKLKERVDPLLKTKINMSEEKDIFSSVISNCIHLLVQDLQLACESHLSEMSKRSWNSLESVGDQSSYVTRVESGFKRTVPLVRANLSKARKYFTQFCLKLANSFVSRYVFHLTKCKPISTVGAEQLLLDTHSLKTLLLDLPSIGSKAPRKAPSSYTKIVIKGMTRAEMLLKVVMTPHEPTAQFVASCLRLLVDANEDTVQKVVDMKGLRKVEQGPILEAFKKSVRGQGSSKSQENNDNSSFRIKKLQTLIDKR